MCYWHRDRQLEEEARRLRLEEESRRRRQEEPVEARWSEEQKKEKEEKTLTEKVVEVVTGVK